ncbi:hypothetical protein FIU93_22650 [Labrenzia sp. THAF35]|uniref:hypothetical protein n=1 Tax=Labrenzia sp. THAF35 TaxID=2587854 RepID=UPI0012A9DB03|nr:hypothetical protein [Labrenzia sp. THAF35]QFT69603.1 hypothetical protein FIU93_22650 [Labrenzia sp. THAF35]
MGFTPQQVNQMSMWQYMAALDGYIRANSPDDQSRLSDKEADEIFAWMKERGDA